MKWTVETSTWSKGLYDVYDEDGNRFVEHTIFEKANLIAEAPNMLCALKRAEQTVRNLAANLEGDLCQIAKNEAINLHNAIVNAEGK